jgi:hypothetical protein
VEFYFSHRHIDLICENKSLFSIKFKQQIFFFSILKLNIMIIINRMLAEELTEYLVASQIDVQVRKVLDRLLE